MGAQVRNAGPGRAKASRVGFYLSRNATKGPGDVRLGRLTTKALRARKRTLTKGSLTVPALSLGTFRVLACADDTKKVRERREKNNCRAANGDVTVLSPLVAPVPITPVPVTPVNDAPVNSVPASAFVPIDETAPITGISVADVDSATLRVTLTGTNGTPSTGSVSGTVAQVNAALAGVTFTPTAGFAGQAALKVVTSDGTLSDADTIAITVAPNHAPVLTATAGTQTYTENDPATAIDPGLMVTDVDGANLAGATVQITANHASGEDVLALTSPPAGISASFDAPSGTLTLAGAATPSAYRQALRAVGYRNASNNPATAPRTVTFTADDGFATGSATRTVAITAVNDPPVLASTAGGAAFTESGGPVTVDALVTIADPDDTQLISGQVAIALPETGDVLVLADAPSDGITVTGSGTATITLAGAASLAAYRDVLRAGTFNNPRTDLVNGSTRTVTFTGNDGDATSNVLARTLAITAANLAPVVSSPSTGAAAFAEGGPAVMVDPLVAVSDEHGQLTRASVSMVSPQVGDTLLWTDPNGADAIVKDAINSTPTTLILTGTGSLAAYQDALRAATYANARLDLTNGTRTVSFAVRDENLNSGPHSRNVAITVVNDKPVVVTGAGTPTWTEPPSGLAPVTVAPNITVSDPDSAAVTGATVTITTPVAGDLLVWTDNDGHDAITATGGATTTLTFSGSGTPANYAAALAAVRFAHSTQDPTSATRTVSFRVTDSGAEQSDDIAASRKNVTVVPVN